MHFQEGAVTADRQQAPGELVYQYRFASRSEAKPQIHSIRSGATVTPVYLRCSRLARVHEPAISKQQWQAIS